MPDVEEDKPEPDLDELLELFREPDEEPRRKAVPGSVWLMLALVLSLGGVWLAARVSSGPASKDTEAGPMKPGKVADRPVRREGEETLDALEDYIARCKKGMTAREVRWIVEDFQKAGLDEGPGSLTTNLGELFKQRSQIDELKQDESIAAQMKGLALQLADRQRAWYGGALADGLKLTQSQRADLKERMAIALSEDRVTFENRLKAFSMFVDLVLNQDSSRTPEEAERISQEMIRLAGGFIGHEMFEEGTYLAFVVQGNWLEKEAYAPWALCDLTAEQLEITRFGVVDNERKRRKEHDGDDQEPAWFGPSSTEVDQEVTGKVPELLGRVGAILPFQPEQQFGETADDMLATAKAMHPAQLKIFLLLNPEEADELEKAIEVAGE